MSQKKKTHHVFGISNEILDDSYIDRGSLDSELTKLLDRKNHIAIRGPSKSGKSWLRQRVIQNSITVQCRLGFTSADIYNQALSEIGAKGTTSQREQINFSSGGELSAGVGLSIAKASTKIDARLNTQTEKTEYIYGKNIKDLRYIAQEIVSSNRRLVIEDLHYLSSDERHVLAHELKTLWDYGCFVVLVGVWGEANLLIHCNPDLSGRLEELSIEWTPDDLRSIFDKGGRALNVHISRDIQNKAIVDCFGNSGLLQRLILRLLDEAKIEEEQDTEVVISTPSLYESAAMAVADQLNGVYQKFAERVANGIRKRSEATGIYAHAMAAIMEAEDRKHIIGISLTEIFNKSSARQPRIQKPNLKSILTKIDGLQVDDNGRGLVVTYDESEEKVLNVDRQLLFYRKYVTLYWPWEDLIRESEEKLKAERRRGGQIDLFSD